MNHQHCIDYAEFDTAFASGQIGQVQQAEFDEFVKSELMRVVDEVFGEVERKSGNRASLRLERLEIDLGEIDYRDFRQQMPQRLRRQLWQALDNARYNFRSQSREPAEQAAADDAGLALFHYLRFGYLPWYASVADANLLETWLLRLVETRPDSLVEFFGSVPNDDIIDRLKSQFSTGLVERVNQLLESPDAAMAPAGDATLDREQEQPDGGLETGSLVDVWQTQLESALSAGEPAEFERLWQSLLRDESAMLVKILNTIGRQAVYRQQLARRLSPRQFAELLFLLEPSAHELLLSILEPGHWVARLVARSANRPTTGDTGLRECLLDYLLFERGDRFDREDFVDSLLGKVSIAGLRQKSGFWTGLVDELETAAQSDDASAELARMALARADKLARSPGADWHDIYQRYARIEAMFSPASPRRTETLLLADIETLVQQAPWLLLGLLRELQGDAGERRKTLRLLAVPLLEKLSYSMLVLIARTVATEASAGSAELVAAIRRRAEITASPQTYYADILTCLIDAEVIDFDVVGVGGPMAATADAPVEESTSANLSQPVEPARRDAIESLTPMGAPAAQLLQFAELLTTASLAAELPLSPPQLAVIKWRFVKNYAGETGSLFNREDFLRRYLETLIEQTGVDDTREFYSLLGQALIRNNLPETREQTRQIIELLDDIAAGPLPAADASETGDVTAELTSLGPALDEVLPDEDIHVSNAGLVLLAPWLPRLFDHLGYIEDGAFIDQATAERAVHCLQFLVDGSLFTPEFQLVLNKILCGVKPGKPIRRGIELSGDETDQLESLLEALTSHWKALQNTSIEGLRESFLQRGGRLQRKGETWQLAVEARSFDMLLDQLPWSYSTIKFGWMERVIYVDWR